jgi:hypothetical protein
MPEFFDDQKGAAPPQISTDYADYVQQTATQIERDNPDDPAMLEHAAKLRAQIEGLAPPIPTDPRTPEQIAHDRRFGVALASDGKPILPSVLADVIQHDASGSAPDPKTVTAELIAAGLDAEKVISEAQSLLSKTGLPIKATALSAGSLLQLSIFAGHLKRHSATRPASQKGEASQ